jgi:alkylation response protein AidB-like acyl-CoA dehydrogenase
MSCFIVEKGPPGFQVVKAIGKLGYKGVDTVELLFDACPVPAANLVGGVEGRGFKHVMSGLETGRLNIAARAVGVAQAVLDETTRAVVRAATAAASPERSRALVRMGAKVEGARRLTYWAGAMKDRGERCDLEAGMAKLHASEIAQEVARDALALVGPGSLLLAGTLERHYRDTPLMIIGEGANEIQRQIVARQLLERHGERFGALTSREGEPAERRQLVLAVRQFVDKEIAPVAAEHDRRRELPAPLRARLADLGVFGALAPAEAGGLDLDLVTTAMIIEEVARGWGALAALLSAHLAASAAVARAAPRERERWLPPMTRGEVLALPVSGRGVTAAASAGEVTLDGEAPLVGGAALAGLLVVRAQVGDGFLVPAGTAGLQVEAPAPGLGLRGLEPATVRLTALRLPRTAQLETWDAARVDTVGRLGVAATAVGIAQAAFEAALRYSQQRSAFGKPICHHQAIQLKLADMASRIAAARLLTYWAAERLAGDAADMLGGAMARAEATETAAFVTLEAMRIHGGYGYTTEFPVERHYRDAAALLASAAG